MHATCMEQGRLAGKKQKDKEHKGERKSIKTFYTEDRCCSVEQAGKAMSNWLTVVPRTANNLVLNKEELGTKF
eukprot:15200035-Ditylum_brightwellii.AAC.1